MFYAPEKCKLKLNNLILNMTIEIGKYCRIFKARFIRRISAVSNSIQLSAAEMRQLIHTSNFYRI